jgi:hypothetical protein
MDSPTDGFAIVSLHPSRKQPETTPADPFTAATHTRFAAVVALLAILVLVRTKSQALKNNALLFFVHV